ncbi:uncharacterized protein LOC112689733 [Sipha flava]|uniref:Uncharacterized protein LOC112689733 n=1 Tax=Sipha flava TaxID=143950 RepID=A0A2S2QBQ6_9HEMI|nr:uncharacterized protein LOC112689733 [Sipha flava]
MWSKVWIVVCLVAAAAAAVVTESHSVNDKKLYKNDGVLLENQINAEDAEKNTIGLNSNERHSTKSFKKAPAPMVDDDLLEFLVRVAENPAEWNKIRRVLSMLGRDETSVQTTTADAITTTTSTTMRPSPTAVPVPVTTTTTDKDRGRGEPVAKSWPSGEWILKAVENIRAAARAKEMGVGDGGAEGDPYDYDDEDKDDDDDDVAANYEIEEIDAPTTGQPQPPLSPSPPPPHPRVAAVGHMSRYQFRRIDGHPGDGRVNGTYVAVVESDRHPPRGIVYNPVRQKKPNPAT